MIREENVRIIFGLKLKHLRHEQEMSLSALSKKSGLSPSYLNEIEKGKKYPKTEKIVALANVFGVSYDDMVSLKLPGSMSAISDLLLSNIINDLPLHMFGFDLSRMVEWMADSPKQVGAFMSTIVEIARNYDMRKEQFYFAALRSYQEVNDNYFEDLEEAVKQFIDEFGGDVKNIIRYKEILAILIERYNYEVREFDVQEFPELAASRYAFIPGPPKNVLLLNADLNENQRLFIVGRELSYQISNVQERPHHSLLVEVPSFEHILNNFNAAYCAAAVLMPKEHIIKDIETFLKMRSFDGDFLLKILTKYQVAPEILFHRMTNILPKFFGIRQLFFIRIQNNAHTEVYDVTRELHLSTLHSPHGNEKSRHYCRRWIAVKILKQLSALQRADNQSGPIISAQRVRYIDSGNDYFCISISRPMAPTPDQNASVTIGFEINTAFKKNCNFWDDTNVPEADVNETCETCRLEDCKERAAEPVIYAKRKRVQEIRKAMERLKKKEG